MRSVGGEGCVAERSKLAWSLLTRQSKLAVFAVDHLHPIVRMFALGSTDNIFYNGPRAAVNLNDQFGGGNVLARNLIFNAVRETADHGPINSWGRTPYAHEQMPLCKESDALFLVSSTSPRPIGPRLGGRRGRRTLSSSLLLSLLVLLLWTGVLGRAVGSGAAKQTKSNSPPARWSPLKLRHGTLGACRCVSFYPLLHL